MARTLRLHQQDQNRSQKPNLDQQVTTGVSVQTASETAATSWCRSDGEPSAPRAPASPGHSAGVRGAAVPVLHPALLSLPALLLRLFLLHLCSVKAPFCSFHPLKDIKATLAFSQRTKGAALPERTDGRRALIGIIMGYGVPA